MRVTREGTGTLATLCAAHGVSMNGAGEDELARIWQRVAEIQKKHATKPRRSSLPGRG